MLGRDTMTMATPIKDKMYLGLAYRFRGLVQYQGRKHFSFYAGIVQEKELRVLHHDPKSVRILASSRC